jgi:small subunit ribosomal protein S17
MPRRVLEGIVVSDKNAKTVVVRVERRIMHPLYKKFMNQTKRFHAHDEQDRFKVGDRVRIRECRPLSRLKRWEVLVEGDAPAAAAAEPAKPAKAKKSAKTAAVG